MDENNPHCYDAPQKDLSSLGIIARLRGIWKEWLFALLDANESDTLAHTHRNTHVVRHTHTYVDRLTLLTYVKIKVGTAHAR